MADRRPLIPTGSPNIEKPQALWAVGAVACALLVGVVASRASSSSNAVARAAKPVTATTTADDVAMVPLVPLTDDGGEGAFDHLNEQLGMPGAVVVEGCKRTENHACVELALDAFFSTLDDVTEKRGVGRVVVFGNSLIVQDRIVDVWRRDLVTRFGDAGRGFVFLDRTTRTGPRHRASDAANGFSFHNVVWGERGRHPHGIGGMLHTSVASAESVFQLHGATSARVFFLDHERAPPLQISVDGHAPIDWSRRAGDALSSKKFRAEVAPVTLKGNESLLTVRTKGRDGVFYGLSLENGKSGIIVDNMSIIGADSTRYLRSDGDIFASQLAALKPNLVTILLGGNEVKRMAWRGMPLAKVKADLRAFIHRIKEAAPSSSCLVTGPLENVEGAQPTKLKKRPTKTPYRLRPQTLTVNDAMRAVALEEGCAFIDLFAAMGGEGALRRLRENGMLNADLIHPTGEGLDLVGALVSESVMARYDDRRRARVVAQIRSAVTTVPETPVPTRQFSLTARGEVLTLKDDGDIAVLDIPAHLSMRHDGVSSTVRGVWREVSPGEFEANAANHDVSAVFHVTSSMTHPRLRASVDVRYARALEVEREAWVFLPKNVDGAVLDRAYQWRPMSKSGAFIDRWTPRVGQWTSARGAAFALVGDDTFESLVVNDRSIAFDIDDKDNHAHTVHLDCFTTTENFRERKDRSARRRAIGEVTSHAVTIVAGAAQVPVLRRWPDGKRAAFSIIDHADGATAETLRAVMYGSARAAQFKGGVVVTNGAPTHGLIGHGVPITKTAFATKEQLLHPQFRALTTLLQENGSEIAPHSVTPWPDSRAAISKALDGTFASFKPKTWVDHQPDTNCEATNNQGGDVGHPGNVVDVLLDHGVRYLWEAPDFLNWYGLNLFDPERPRVRATVFHPGHAIAIPGRDTPWLFRSAWLYLPRDVVLPRLKPSKFDALESEHGIHIAHLYLGLTKDIDDPDGKSIFERDKKRGLSLRKPYDDVFKDLGRRRQKGTLFLEPMGTIGDWMVQWSTARLVIVDHDTVMLVARDDGQDDGLDDDGDRRRFTVHAGRDTTLANGNREVLMRPFDTIHVDGGITEAIGVRVAHQPP